MSIFYTGKGDKGKSVVGNKWVNKISPVIIALGALDELNSLLGMIKNQKLPFKIRKQLHQMQENLFIIQANFGSLLSTRKHKPPAFKSSKVSQLETEIDKIEKHLKPAKKFIIPGAGLTSAWLDYARAVARRTESHAVTVSEKYNLPDGILAYLNRLSSMLFALARYEAKRLGKKEMHPSYH